MNFTPRSGFALSSAIALFLTSFVTYASETPYLDEISEIIAEKKPANVDALLEALPARLKKIFLVVYDSRSTQSATPDSPRIILTTPDHQFYLAFSGDTAASPSSSDSHVEMIEQYGLGDSHFAEITFPGQVPNLNRQPETCVSCHRGGPIFDGYPHWPGFIGSTHNGRAYGEDSGSGRIARLEFEENALAKFLKNAPEHSRYRHLDQVSPVPLDLAEFARRNAIIGGAIIGRSHQRQSNFVVKNTKSLKELEDAFILSKAMEEPESNVPIPQYLEERFAEYRSFLEIENVNYERAVELAEIRKFDRLQILTSIYGTENDRKRLREATLFNATDTFRPEYKPYPPVRDDLGIPVANVMNYFGRRARFRYPGIYYQSLRAKNPELYPDELGTSLGSRDIRDITGITSAYVLSEWFTGFEDVDATGFAGARSYRDLRELYAWVPSPLKDVAYEELESTPILRTQIGLIQESYFEILKASPLFEVEGAKLFLQMKSLTPENRTKLEALIAERSTP